MLEFMDKAHTEPKLHYSTGEEIAHSISHGIGAGLAIVALVVLLMHAYHLGDGWRLACFTVYGISLISVFTTSTLYHAFQHPPTKRVFQVLDHAAIFLLIAGTYTPFTLVSLGGVFGWTIFGLIWVMAVAGIVLKVSYMNRLERLGHWMYLGMGWIGLLALYPLVHVLPINGVFWLLAGGLFYSVGVLFYVGNRFAYTHFVWHLFVMGGALCHFVAIFKYVSPLSVT
jgi:hemolysin III